GDRGGAGVEVIAVPDAGAFRGDEPAAYCRRAGHEYGSMDLRVWRHRPRRRRDGRTAACGNLSATPLHIAGRQRSHRLGGAARIKRTAGDALVGVDGRIRLEHDAVLDESIVEDDDVVVDGDIAAHRAGVHACVLADRHAVADDAGEDAVIDVQGGAGAEME